MRQVLQCTRIFPRIRDGHPAMLIKRLKRGAFSLASLRRNAQLAFTSPQRA
jgi:lambda repressor-like predicted transcriptional regulator